MDTRIHVRGRVTTTPLALEEVDGTRVTFLLENRQLDPAREGDGECSGLEEWCEVVCDSALGDNVLRYVGMGDYVSVWGELRVMRTSHDVDSVILTLMADTVGHDLCFEVERSSQLVAG